jgi:hypothetical protein
MKAWTSWYRKIAERLGLDQQADELTARTLQVFLPEPDLEGLRDLLKGRECVIFGAGPSLEEDVLALSLKGYLDKVVIAADGATSIVKNYRRPDIVVTDLDGKLGDLFDAWKRGAWLVIHAHGDNLPKIQDIALEIRAGKRVIGTTQLKPFGKLFNFGGFTDGDRAAFMAHALGASKIYLAGMDLGKEIGRFSGSKDPQRTRVKLEICKELLSWLSKELGAKLVNLTSRGEEIPNIPSAAP